MASFATVSSQDVKVDPAFMLIYNQVIDLNHDRFDNINLIQIGDTVLFPARSGQGVEYWVADAPQRGMHDCIWILTKKYLEQSLETTEIQLVPTAKPTIKNWFWEIMNASIGVMWIMLIIFIITLCFIIWLIIHIIKNRKNPDTYPAVMGNIKSLEDRQVARVIQQHINQNQKITKIERGILVRNSGPKKIKVDMEFGDNKNRWVYLKPGERVTKVTIENPNGTSHEEFWREHCGNYFAVIKRGRVELPKGWIFQVNSTTSTKKENAKTENSETTTATADKPAPASITLTDGQRILEGALIINKEDEGTKIAFLIKKSQEPTV